MIHKKSNAYILKKISSKSKNEHMMWQRKGVEETCIKDSNIIFHGNNGIISIRTARGINGISNIPMYLGSSGTNSIRTAHGINGISNIHTHLGISGISSIHTARGISGTSNIHMCLGINGTSSIHTVRGINGITFIIKANQFFTIEGPVLLGEWTFCV
jgi:hypothetical protein